MTEVGALHAWVDESIQRTDGSGCYLLAAAVIRPSGADGVRDELRRLLPGRSRRLHWRDEGMRRRRILAGAVASIEAVHTVVIGTPVDHRRQERARRLCLERLVFELRSRGVTHVWMESRTPTLNARDRMMVDVLRIRRVIGDDLVVDTALPEQEPLLWLPDIVAGAVGLDRRGGDPAPYRMLRDRLILHEVSLS
jgi:hypothetical protein